MTLPFLQEYADLCLHGGSAGLARKLDDLLTIFNGDWRSSDLTHHCSLACACGCRNELEVKLAAVRLFSTIIVGCRPPVPALSKWLRCSQAARWFFLASAIHGLLPRGFDLLYGVSRKQLRLACADLDADLRNRASSTGADVSEHTTGSAFTLPDLPLPSLRTQRQATLFGLILS